MDSDGINRQWTDLRLALAYPVLPNLFIGLTGRYLQVNQAVARGPFGKDLVSDGTPDQGIASLFTFNAGVTYRPVKQLSLGRQIHNPVGTARQNERRCFDGAGVGNQPGRGVVQTEQDVYGYRARDERVLVVTSRFLLIVRE